MADVVSPSKGNPVVPDITLRTWRISSALALATLLLPLALNDSAAQADATATPSQRRTQAEAAPGPLHPLLDPPLHAVGLIRHRPAAKAPAPAPHKATEPHRRPRPATRPRPTAPRTGRSSVRPALAPTLAGAQRYARARMTPAQYSCMSSVISRESSWNPYARNPQSGAYGLFQALPGSKMASAGSDWRTNPLTQMRWGLSYMRARYGSPCGAWHFWQKNRWY